MKETNFRGDLHDISTVKEALLECESAARSLSVTLCVFVLADTSVTSGVFALADTSIELVHPGEYLLQIRNANKLFVF